MRTIFTNISKESEIYHHNDLFRYCPKQKTYVYMPYITHVLFMRFIPHIVFELKQFRL